MRYTLQTVTAFFGYLLYTVLPGGFLCNSHAPQGLRKKTLLEQMQSHIMQKRPTLWSKARLLYVDKSHAEAVKLVI